MHRSSSFANIKIDFNPRQAKVGHSSIDKLPIRRSSSHKTISQISQIAQQQQKATLQSQQVKIDMLKRVNESLERENQFLKKQLDYFTQACSSRRASISGIPNVGSIKKEESGYRDKILSRMDSKVDKNKNDTESTGLFNSKFSNSGRKTDHLEETISEIYYKLNFKGLLPKADAFQQLTCSFMETIKESYLKLEAIADEINKKNRESQRVPKQTNDILRLLQTIVLYHKNPKMGVDALKEKQRQRAKNSRNEVCKQQRIQQILNQFCSASDLIVLFQATIKMVVKNPKITTYLKNSITFSRLLKKITSNS